MIDALKLGGIQRDQRDYQVDGLAGLLLPFVGSILCRIRIMNGNKHHSYHGLCDEKKTPHKSTHVKYRGHHIRNSWYHSPNHHYLGRKGSPWQHLGVQYLPCPKCISSLSEQNTKIASATEKIWKKTKNTKIIRKNTNLEKTPKIRKIRKKKYEKIRNKYGKIRMGFFGKKYETMRIPVAYGADLSSKVLLKFVHDSMPLS